MRKRLGFSFRVLFLFSTAVAAVGATATEESAWIPLDHRLGGHAMLRSGGAVSRELIARRTNAPAAWVNEFPHGAMVIEVGSSEVRAPRVDPSTVLDVFNVKSSGAEATADPLAGAARSLIGGIDNLDVAEALAPPLTTASYSGLEMHYIVPEPSAYGILGAGACVALLVVRGRRGRRCG